MKIPEGVRLSLHDRAFATPVAARCMALARPKWRSLIAGPDTDIVIDGYPRSANTYSVAAFYQANGQDFRVAHHTHAAVTIATGVRLGRPTVMLIRNPVDAVTSLLIMRWADNDVSIRGCFRRYLHFYERAMRVVSSIVVAPFETVITDFGSVIDSVNRKFGSSFTPYVRSPCNERAIRSTIETWFARQNQGELDELRIGRPSTKRSLLAGEVKDRVRDHRLAQPCEDLYRAIVECRPM